MGSSEESPCCSWETRREKAERGWRAATRAWPCPSSSATEISMMAHARQSGDTGGPCPESAQVFITASLASWASEIPSGMKQPPLAGRGVEGGHLSPRAVWREPLVQMLRLVCGSCSWPWPGAQAGGPQSSEKKRAGNGSRFYFMPPGAPMEDAFKVPKLV